MANSRGSSISYEIPQEQLSYFDPHAKSTLPAKKSTPSRLVSSQRGGSSAGEAGLYTSQHGYRRRNYPSAFELAAAVHKGSLNQQYQQYFTDGHKTQSELQGRDTQSGTSESRSVESTPQRELDAPTQAAHKPTSAPPASVPPRSASAQSRQTEQSSNAPRAYAASSRHEAETEEFYFNHKVPATAAPQKSPPPEPKLNVEKVSSTPRTPSAASREYGQQESCPQLPAQKLALDPKEPEPQVQEPSTARPYVTRSVEAPPVGRHTLPQAPEIEEAHGGSFAERDSEYERMRDDEENCTFRPRINNPSHPRSKTIRDSKMTNRGSDGNFQERFDDLHRDAQKIQRAGESRRAQRDADDAERERNARRGENGRETTGNGDAEQEAVFDRLYADAQRINKEKAEQERLLELKRQEERVEAPFDWDKGKERKSGETVEGTADGETRPPQRGRQSSTTRPVKNRAVFDRLARPSSVTISFQKQKQLEEEEKQEKEMREADQRREGMEKYSGYQWKLPAKSFTFADLQSHNAKYIS